MTEQMVMDYLIIEAVRELCRRERFDRPVLARDIHEWADETGVYAHTGTIRRHMARLADAGRLLRVADRKGYVVPDWRRVRLPEIVFPEQSGEYQMFEYDDLGDDGAYLEVG